MDETTPDLPVRASHPLYANDVATGTRVGYTRSHYEKREQSRALRAVIGDTRVLYAVQLGDGIIKIGCTDDLAARHRHFRAKGGVVLGFTAGDYDDELALHRSLRAHVARGREYYHPTPEVLAVINEWRDAFSLPHLAA